ncbi:752_t:CDS:2 [Dentiscutata erythropus]|uniref:752_t:CDS:1 n=1 Tax=Dentiscutata erythropus TaxID=1348616 RepID=A0A9N9G6V5_9GLOM|nr:752_t:CDS:2 [Dentiscutata erythropus]
MEINYQESNEWRNEATSENHILNYQESNKWRDETSESHDLNYQESNEWHNETSESHDLSRLISGPTLAFINVRLTNLTENNFFVTFSVINTESHPLEITFLNDIQVSFEHTIIGKMSMSNKTINVTPQKNVKLEVKFIPSGDFNSFSRFLFTNEKLDWHLEGNTSVKFMAQDPIKVRLSKHIEFDGMKVLAVNNIDAPSEYPDGGISVSMNITNASQIRIKLGKTSFDIIYMNQIIGKISSTCFSTDRNTLSFSGCLLPANTKEEIDAMTNAFYKFLSGEELQLTFDARGSSVSWLNKITLTIVITKETKINFNYEFIKSAWDFKFDPNDQHSPKLSLQYGLKYSNLFPLGIHGISGKIILIYKGSQFATLSIPYSTATDSLGIIESSFTTKLKITSEDSKDLFNEIAKKIFMAEDVIFTVEGVLNVILKTPIGDIDMKKIQFNFDKNIKCKIQPGIIINSMEIIDATKDAIEIRASATITNPSNIRVDLSSNVEFDLISDQNIKVANMIIENFKLKRGNEDVIVKLNNNTTLIDSLREVFKAIKLEALFPGINARFINEIEVSLRTKDSFMLHNPLKTKLYIFGFNSKVFNLENKQIAVGITERSDVGTVVEPGQAKRIRIENTNMDIGNAIRNIKDCVNGVKENVECVLMFGIGEDINNLFKINVSFLY